MSLNPGTKRSIIERVKIKKRIENANRIKLAKLITIDAIRNASFSCDLDTYDVNTGIKAVHAVMFTQYLFYPSRGGQVEALQQFLAQDKTIYPEGLITGYFGPLTERAVQRFQERYGVAKEGDEGYGFFGPKTRAKMNSLEIF